MRLVATLITFPLLALAGPQFTVMSGTCNTGWGDGGTFSDNRGKPMHWDACQGCAVFGNPGTSNEFEMADPCYGCQGKLKFVKNGQGFNFYHEDGRQAGVCNRLGGNDYCSQWNYSCSYYKDLLCEFFDANYYCDG